MGKEDFVAWQIMQFFSIGGAEQKLLIGNTDEEWFIEEDENNVGANYLIGLCAAYLECPRCGVFDVDSVDQFREKVLFVKDHFDPAYWRFDDLCETEEWQALRKLANLCIEALGPVLYPLRKPFKIENLIHVGHYKHAKEIRKMLKIKKKK
jgi:hypothetical protein